MQMKAFPIVLFFLLQGAIAFGQTYIYKDLNEENISDYTKIIINYFYRPFEDYEYVYCVQQGKTTTVTQYIRQEKQSVITSVYDTSGNLSQRIQTYNIRRGGHIIDTLRSNLTDEDVYHSVYNDREQLERRSSKIYNEEAKTGWRIEYTYNHDGLLSSEYKIIFINGTKETEKTTYNYDKHNNITEITREATPENKYPVNTNLGKQYRHEKFEYEYIRDVWVKKYWSSESKRKQLLVSRRLFR